MKVLFNHQMPFMLAHGGLQTQIEQTMKAVADAGAQVEPLRWWDPAQKGDVLHFFGRAPLDMITAAHGKNISVVQEELLTEQGSRPRARLRGESLVRGVASLFSALHRRQSWHAYRMVDASIANTRWEAEMMREFYGAPPGRVHVVPNGVEDLFLNAPAELRGDTLVCSATITERKRVLELAEAAVLAHTPLLFVGRPYSACDPYAQRFAALVNSRPDLLRHQGAVDERAALARIYRQARGFVLLSGMETRSLASEEAAASGCPLLLSDLPWARSVFGADAHYCPVSNTARTAVILRKFYEAAPLLPAPPQPMSWAEVGGILHRVYEEALRTSR